MKSYNTVIIGGGASGILAGIYLNDQNSLLIEKNHTLAEKILITGGGRCNITNTSPLKEYVKKYQYTGNFYRNAFKTFFYEDIINLLEENGCETKIEDNVKIFPTTDNARSVHDTLNKIIEDKTPQMLDANVTDIIQNHDQTFTITINNNKKIKAYHVILATGSDAYPQTGSNGDGLRFAVKLGHSKPEHKLAGLAPINFNEKWINKLAGISLDAKIEFKANKKSIIKIRGSILFTHNGLSGNEIYDASSYVDIQLKEENHVKASVDFLPDISYDTLNHKMQEDFKNNPNWGIKRYIHNYLPGKMSEVFLKNMGIDEITILNQLTKKQRNKLCEALKNTQLTVKDVPENLALVRNSGVKQEEIDPNSCESRIVKNLYIVGELIEGNGMCGGFNLQKAYSTGVLAAKSINEEKK